MLLLSLSSGLQAGAPLSAADGATRFVEPSALEQLWSLATLYKDDGNPFLQEFKLRERYHGQYHWLDSEQGNDEGWEDRRSRFGFDAKLFDKTIELRADFRSSDGFDPFYNGLVDAFLKWKPSEDFSLSARTPESSDRCLRFPATVHSLLDFRALADLQSVESGSCLRCCRRRQARQVHLPSGHLLQRHRPRVRPVRCRHRLWRWGWLRLEACAGSGKGGSPLDYLHSDIQAQSTVLDRYEHVFSSTLWLKEGRWSLVTGGVCGLGPLAGRARIHCAANL